MKIQSFIDKMNYEKEIKRIKKQSKITMICYGIIFFIIVIILILKS